MLRPRAGRRDQRGHEGQPRDGARAGKPRTIRGHAAPPHLKYRPSISGQRAEARPAACGGGQEPRAGPPWILSYRSWIAISRLYSRKVHSTGSSVRAVGGGYSRLVARGSAGPGSIRRAWWASSVILRITRSSRAGPSTANGLREYGRPGFPPVILRPASALLQPHPSGKRHKDGACVLGKACGSRSWANRGPGPVESAQEWAMMVSCGRGPDDFRCQTVRLDG